MNYLPEDSQSGQPRRTEPSVPCPDARTRRVTRLLFAGGLLLLGSWVVRDFLLALAWAVVIAITVWPLYARFAALLPRRGRAAFLAPLLFTLLTAIVLLVPDPFERPRSGPRHTRSFRPGGLGRLDAPVRDAVSAPDSPRLRHLHGALCPVSPRSAARPGPSGHGGPLLGG